MPRRNLTPQEQRQRTSYLERVSQKRRAVMAAAAVDLAQDPDFEDLPPTPSEKATTIAAQNVPPNVAPGAVSDPLPYRDMRQRARGRTQREQTPDTPGYGSQSQSALSRRLRLASSQLQSRLRQQKESAARQAQNEIKQQVRRKVQRTVQNALQRGIVVLVNFIAVALDLSTSGVTLIINILNYSMTFAWLNLQMFYGSFWTKGESILVPPLDWDPIKVPLSNVYLYIALLFADVLLILAIFLFCFGITLVIMFAYTVMTDPLTAMQIFGTTIF